MAKRRRTRPIQRRLVKDESGEADLLTEGPPVCVQCGELIENDEVLIFGKGGTGSSGRSEIRPYRPGWIMHRRCVPGEETSNLTKPRPDPSLRPRGILDRLMLTTTPIEVGAPPSIEMGTGFFVEGPSEKGQSERTLLVTNRHVVMWGTTGSVYFHDSKADRPPGESVPEYGSRRKWKLENWESRWTFHKDDKVDIAVTDVSTEIAALRERGREPYVQTLPPELFSTGAEEAILAAVENVLFVGYPEGIYDSVHNLPVIRQAITATPIRIPYEGSPAFLIDSSIYHGASGSPVFVSKRGIRVEGSKGQVGNVIRCVGILAKTFENDSYARAKLVDIPGRRTELVKVRTPLGLSLAFRGSAIREVVESLKH